MNRTRFRMRYFLLPVFLLTVYLAFYGSYYIEGSAVHAEDLLTEMGNPYPAVIAHRGASIVAPESTRSAYEIARDLGVDYFEADLQRTADGRIVIFHDATLERTSNVAQVFPDRVGEEIGRFTLEELRRLEYGSWFHPDFEGLEILTLEDLIEIARGGDRIPGLILESKHPYKYPGIEEDIVAVLSESGWMRDGPPGHRIEQEHRTTSSSADDPESAVVPVEDRTKTIFFSFSFNSLREFKRLAPLKPRILLVADNTISRRQWLTWLDIAEPIAHGIGPKGFMAWPWHIAAAHNRGIFVFPYTINHLWQIQVLSRFQAAGFITDRPKVVMDFLNGINGITAGEKRGLEP
jgi:glycerophosphoryl diester phosphodiesterase